MKKHWFECVACVIVYNSARQIFLGKRPQGSAEGGKWGIVGGIGEFKSSRDRFDFPFRELKYDLGNRVDYGRLEHVETVFFGDRKFLRVEEIYSYKTDDPIWVSGKRRAPVEGIFFSIGEIGELNNRGIIAFDNFDLIKRFAEKKDKTGW